MAIISPQEVKFITINADKKTATVGLTNGTKETISRSEANQLSKAVETHRKLLDKYEKEHGIIHTEPPKRSGPTGTVRQVRR